MNPPARRETPGRGSRGGPSAGPSVAPPRQGGATPGVPSPRRPRCGRGVTHDGLGLRGWGSGPGSCPDRPRPAPPPAVTTPGTRPPTRGCGPGGVGRPQQRAAGLTLGPEDPATPMSREPGASGIGRDHGGVLERSGHRAIRRRRRWRSARGHLATGRHVRRPVALGVVGVPVALPRRRRGDDIDATGWSDRSSGVLAVRTAGCPWALAAHLASRGCRCAARAPAGQVGRAGACTRFVVPGRSRQPRHGG